MTPVPPTVALGLPADVMTGTLLLVAALATLAAAWLGVRLKRAHTTAQVATARAREETEVVQALLDGADGAGQAVILAEGTPPAPTRANLAAAELTGRAHRDLLELESIWELFPQDARDRLSALLRGQGPEDRVDPTLETRILVPGHHGPVVKVTPVPLATDRLLLVLGPQAPEARVQQALEEATERSTSLVQSIACPVLEIDLQGRIRIANQPLLGMGPRELQGRTLVDLFPSNQQAQVKSALVQALDEGRAASVTVAEPGTGDEGAIYKLEASPIRRGGRITGATVTYRDVSQGTRAVQVARRNENLLAATLDSLPRAIAILDDEARIQVANEAWQEGRVGRLPGATQHAVAEDYLEILDRVSNGQGPLAEVAEGIRDVQQGRLQRFTHEYEVVDDTQWVQVRIAPLPGTAGSLVISLEDITDRRWAQAERERASEQFEVAVGELSRSVGAATDPTLIAQRLVEAALRVSHAQGAGVVGSEGLLTVRGRDPSHATKLERLLGEDPSRLAWFQASLSDAEHPVDLVLLPEHRSLDEDQAKKVEILATQAALALQRAEVLARIRRAYEELDRSLRQKQIFMDVLSHDLKNPLAVARGRVELLSMKHPEATDDLSTVEESLTRAEDLIEKAVFYSRLEEQEAIELGERDLVQLTWEVVDALQPLAGDQDIELDVQGPDFLLHPSHPMLARALENLVSNAIKWSPRDAPVRIELEQTRGSVRITVVDHGPGIPEEDRRKLFSRFSRVDRSGVQGTGLGLAIAKRIVEMHEGTIRAEETPGGGSTFVIELPYDPSEPAKEHADQGLPGEGTPA